MLGMAVVQHRAEGRMLAAADPKFNLRLFPDLLKTANAFIVIDIERGKADYQRDNQAYRKI